MDDVCVVLSGDSSDFYSVEVERVFLTQRDADKFIKVYKDSDDSKRDIRLVKTKVTPDNRSVAYQVVFNPTLSRDKVLTSTAFLVGKDTEIDKVWKEEQSYLVNVYSDTRFFSCDKGMYFIKRFMESNS